MDLKLFWHAFLETYHYAWLLKYHGKFPDKPRYRLSVAVNRHLDRYWHHRSRLL